MSDAASTTLVRQHIGWLNQYIAGMTEANWADMRLRAERQLHQLSEVLAQAKPDCGVTDAMCEAAVQVETSIHIQGFTYATRHVIRDVSKYYDYQKLWEIDKNDADAEEKFYHQCRIERMRKVLIAALSTQSPESN